MAHPDLIELEAVAHRLADAARVATLSHFRTPSLDIDNKADGGFDPVTVADRAAEQAMRQILGDCRPDDGIIGEEFGTKDGTSGLTWVLDPIDGTRAFMSGAPVWGVLIALNDADGPLLGIIDQPYIGERFIGHSGCGRLLRGASETPLGVRSTRDLAQATLLTTFPEIGAPEERAAFERVRDAVRLTRYGLDCYGYALLAAGQVDLVIEAGLAAYDIAAPIAVIEAAGGMATSWDGSPVHDGGRVIAAATPELHAAAMALLANDR